MKNLRKTILLTLLALTMVLSCAGCAGTDSPDSTEAVEYRLCGRHRHRRAQTQRGRGGNLQPLRSDRLGLCLPRRGRIAHRDRNYPGFQRPRLHFRHDGSDHGEYPSRPSGQPERLSARARDRFSQRHPTGGAPAQRACRGRPSKHPGFLLLRKKYQWIGGYD